MPFLPPENSIHYVEHGEGPPLFLVHGAARSAHVFDAALPVLARRHRVVAPDLRGLGRSGRSAAPVHPSVWVDDLVRLIETRGGGEPVVLYGVSLGARIVARLALTRPELVRVLVVDSPMVGVSRAGNATLDDQFTRLAATPAGEPLSAQAQFFAGMHGEDWRDVLGFYAASRRDPGFQSYLTVGAELPGLSTPTLVCRGDRDDPVHPLADAFAWHRDAPATQLWIVPGSTQASALREDPFRFLAALDEFLETSAAGPAAPAPYREK